MRLCEIIWVLRRVTSTQHCFNKFTYNASLSQLGYLMNTYYAQTLRDHEEIRRWCAKTLSRVGRLTWQPPILKACRMANSRYKALEGRDGTSFPERGGVSSGSQKNKWELFWLRGRKKWIEGGNTSYKNKTSKRKGSRADGAILRHLLPFVHLEHMLVHSWWWGSIRTGEFLPPELQGKCLPQSWYRLSKTQRGVL